VAQFVYGSRGHVPDFMVRDGEVYRIVSDQVGSVRLVVNAGDVSDVLFRAEYTAFGEMTVLEGDVEATPFGFAGGLFDAETGLVRFGARDYDPVVGRWTAKDPIRWEGEQGNLYVYVESDPVNRIDPTGLRGPTGRGCRALRAAGSFVQCTAISLMCGAAGTPLAGLVCGALCSAMWFAMDETYPCPPDPEPEPGPSDDDDPCLHMCCEY